MRATMSLPSPPSLLRPILGPAKGAPRSRAFAELMAQNPVEQLDTALATYMTNNPSLRRGAFTFLAAPPGLTSSDLGAVLTELRAYVARVYPKLRALGVLGVSLAPTRMPDFIGGCVDVAVMRDPNIAVPMGWAGEPATRVALLARDRAAADPTQPVCVSLGVSGVVAPDMVIHTACEAVGLVSHIYAGDFVDVDTGESLYVFLPIMRPSPK